MLDSVESDSALASSAAKRSGRRVALVAMYPTPDKAMPEFISNHGVRMVEAMLKASELPGLEVVVFDLHDATADDLADALTEWDPDIVGFSAYLWSFPLFAEVAEALHAADPTKFILFGGPSAQPAMFDQTPFHQTRNAVDALILGEGEHTFLELVELTDRNPDSVVTVSGVAVWEGSEWTRSKKRALSDLNQLPSPYVMNLVPPGGLGVLQTYRGCPYTCSFCEWGRMESPRRVRTAAHLVEEFEAMDRLNVDGALLVDAGLNLNSRAFEQLDQAALQSDFFRNRKLISEVYPAKIQDCHIDFLKRIGNPLVGIGLQSFDNSVLANVERSYEESRFISNVQQLTEVAKVAIEIIMGLPGDSPEKFRDSYYRARSFPCALRVYHCCVLPSALMVRSPPEHELDYDPVTLKINSCLGWSKEDIQREVDFLSRESQHNSGQSGEYFWVFSPPHNPAIKPHRSEAA